jgi:hypothetical protein
VARSQSGDAHLPEDGFDVLTATRVSVRRRRSEHFFESRHFSSVCVTVIGSAATDVVRSSATNAAKAMPASFFVPWNVLDAYRLRRLLSRPTDA